MAFTSLISSTVPEGKAGALVKREIWKPAPERMFTYLCPGHSYEVSDRDRDLERVSKQIDKLVEAIIEGADALAVNAKLKLLEEQKTLLEAKVTETPEPEPLLHPALSTVYRNAVERLETLLHHPDTREEAFSLIRSLIDAVILTPVDGRLEIELHGDLAGILALSEAGKQSASSPTEKALQIKMVAGARNQRYLHLDHAIL